MDVPFAVCELIVQLETCGFEAYAVGGCVRDMLLGKQPQDWDLCTNATPRQIQSCFLKRKQILTGIIHGTVGVVVDGQVYEITTYRLETVYSDGRHPDGVSFVGSLEKDLARRDFTINAMAYHPRKGLVDFWNGREDLANRCLRCVGDPLERFREDGLRILRGLRFGATYGLSLQPQTASAAIQCRDGLERISAERIQSELKKLLLGKDAPRIVAEFPAIFAAVLSLPDHPAYWEKAAGRIAQLPQDLSLRLAGLLDDAAKEAKGILTRLRFDKKTTQEVMMLLAYPMQSTDPLSVKYLLRDVGPKLGRKIFLFQSVRTENPELAGAGCQQIQSILDAGCSYARKQLAVDGTDLMQLGIIGKQIGECLEDLLIGVMENPMENQRALLLQKAGQWKKERAAFPQSIAKKTQSQYNKK